MAGVSSIYTTIVDRKNGPGLLRSPKTASNPLFALAGNALGFGRGLLPNSGLLENRNDFEWEMGCLSWQQGTSAGLLQGPTLPGALPGDGGIVESFAGAKAIKFRCNPSDVQWSMRQRSQEQKTKAGTVLHVWNDNQRKTYFDEPVLTINFQSGNILPTRSILNPQGTIPEGLNNFYEFMSLVDEVKVMDDGRANLCYINYNSLIFPSITLWGFWTPNGISFADKAGTHAQVNNWTASFTVYKSVPELGRAIETINQSITDGSLAGAPLRSKYEERVGFTYSNRRSETFGLVQDISTTARGVVTGQIPPRDVAAAGSATIEAASQRIVTRGSTALAGIASQALATPRTAGF